MAKGAAIILFIFLGIIGISAYLITTFYSKYPNSMSQRIAQSVEKYPNAQNWEIKSPKSLCIYYFDGCQEAPVVITFKTQDNWSTLYFFYRESFRISGWQTNSQIITQIPNQITFTNNDFADGSICEAQLAKPKEGIFDLGSKDKKRDIYKFEITCFFKK